MSEEVTKRPVGGGFMKKIDRDENLRRYYREHPGMTHRALAHVFKISRARVTQILRAEHQIALPIIKDGN